MAPAGRHLDNVTIENGSKITVLVLQALPDLILVSFNDKGRKFQGVLLDSNKRCIPCGVYPPSGSFPPLPNLSNEKLYSVKQRHSYFCDDSDAKKGLPEHCVSAPNSGKQKTGGRMSVRLRPRQVLCSVCRSICNEKNENVGKTTQNKKPMVSLQFSKTVSTCNTASIQNNLTVSLNKVSGKFHDDSLSEGCNHDKTTKNAVKTPLTRSKRKRTETDSVGTVNSKAKKLRSFDSKSSFVELTTQVESSNNELLQYETSNKSKVSSLRANRSTRSSNVLKSTGPDTKCMKSPSFTQKQGASLKLRLSAVKSKYSSDVSSVPRYAEQTCDLNDQSSIPKMVLTATAFASENETKPIENHDVKHVRSFAKSKHSESGDLNEESIFSSVPKLTIAPFKKPEIKSDKNVCRDGAECDKHHAGTLLKISILPDGTGTIISPKSPSRSFSDEKSDSMQQMRANTCTTAKAAKRALKKAKKDAQRKFGAVSPSYALLGGMSPRFGGMSPHALLAERRSGLSPIRISSPARAGGASPGKLSIKSPARSSIVTTLATEPLDLSCKTVPVTAKCLDKNTKKHRHKVKHKKKHKEDRKHKVLEEDISPDHLFVENVTTLKTTISISKDSDKTNQKESSTSLKVEMPMSSGSSTCSRTSSPIMPGRQKLSLSFKRISNESNEYVACESSSNDNSENGSFVNDASDHSSNSRSTSKNLEHACVDGKASCQKKHRFKDGCDSNDEHSDVPDFPSDSASSPSNWQTVASCIVVPRHLQQSNSSTYDPNELKSGVEESSPERLISIGDIVWGKVHGFPWWPAKVTGLQVAPLPCTPEVPEGSVVKHMMLPVTVKQTARVSWFGSSTCSLLDPNTLLPFSQFYKQQYIKKKRGPYKVAVKRAALEAQTRDAELNKPNTIKQDEDGHLQNLSSVCVSLQSCDNRTQPSVAEVVDSHLTQSSFSDDCFRSSNISESVIARDCDVSVPCSNYSGRVLVKCQSNLEDSECSVSQIENGSVTVSKEIHTAANSAVDDLGLVLDLSSDVKGLFSDVSKQCVTASVMSQNSEIPVVANEKSPNRMKSLFMKAASTEDSLELSSGQTFVAPCDLVETAAESQAVRMADEDSNIDVSSVLGEMNYKAYPKFKTSKVNCNFAGHLLSQLFESEPNSGLPDSEASTSAPAELPVGRHCSALTSFDATSFSQSFAGTSPRSDQFAHLAGGCSPDVQNSPGEPRLGLPAPCFSEDQDLLSGENVSRVHAGTNTLLPTGQQGCTTKVNSHLAIRVRPNDYLVASSCKNESHAESSGCDSQSGRASEAAADLQATEGENTAFAASPREVNVLS